MVVAEGLPVMEGSGSTLHEIVTGVGQVMDTCPLRRAIGEKASHRVKSRPIHLPGEGPWGLAPGKKIRFFMFDPVVA